MDFKNRFKELRNYKNLTQTELGKILNLSKQAISSYENGVSFPPQDVLTKIADYFKVSTDYLLGRSEIRNPEDELSIKDKKEVDKELNKLVKKLEEQDGLMFDGEPLDDMSKELLLQALENSIKIAKTANKKYTPKKYRGDIKEEWHFELD